jgi:hypothetical protein
MTILRSSAVAALVAFPALAQTGNEVIFVGTSTSGSTDNSAMVESATGAILFVGPDSFTNNVSDAVWADTGRNLYCSRSLGNQVSRGQWSGSGTTWSTFFSAPGACYGLGHDTGRKLLWVLTGATSSTRELHCLDADLNSAGYGTVLAQTTTLGNASRERWGLSPSGNLAAVPHMFINTGLFELIDTDPSSPTFLQVLVSTQVPGASAAGFAFVSDCRVSIDDAYAYVLYRCLCLWDVELYELESLSFI